MELSIHKRKLGRLMKMTRFIKPFSIFIIFLISGIVFGLFRPTIFPVIEQKPNGIHILNNAVPDSTPFQRALSRGDQYFKNKDYLNAKASYQVAIDLVPTDSIAKVKLHQTMDILRSQKAQNILYDVALASADKLFRQKDYERARQEYENASRLMPSESYPRQKVNEIIKILVDQQVLEENYAQSISRADVFFHDSNFMAALPEYQIAASLKPEEKYPADRVTQLTAIVKAMQVRDEAYKKIIDRADLLMNTLKYSDAEKAYKDALVIKPDQAYPKTKISEIDRILAREKRIAEDFDRYINLGDSLYIAKDYLRARENYKLALSVKPAEAYPREMVRKAESLLTTQESEIAKNIDDQYSLYIANGDRLLAEKSYDASRSEYENALKIKPAEIYPQEKLSEIKAELDKLLKNKNQVDQYNALIIKADKFFTSKQYQPSRDAYEQALKIKQGESYPAERIRELDSIFSDLRRQKELNERYQSILTLADKLLLDKSYEQARTEYLNAGSLKPEEQYPKNKIAGIDKILLEIAAKKSREEQFAQLIVNADLLLSEKSYEQAKDTYLQALELKPAELYPKNKIAEINQALAAIKKQQSIDALYNQLLTTADQLLEAKDYQKAKMQYQEALKIKPISEYPQSRIREIDLALQYLQQQKILDDQYAAIVQKADKFMLAGSYEEARAEYLNAELLRPTDQYVKDKIAELDKIATEIAARKAKEEQYAQWINNADQLLAAKSYPQALDAYQHATELKPEETYPKSKMSEIDQVLAGLAKQKELEAYYTQLISSADKDLVEKSYESARAKFVEALTLKPSEIYPKSKISEIDLIQAEINKKKVLDDQYTEALQKADSLFADHSYALAKSAYQDAGLIKPGEQYHKNKIAETDKILAQIEALRILDQRYSAALAKADKSMEDKLFEQARMDYINAGNIKPEEQYPKDRILLLDGIIAENKAKEESFKTSITKADDLLLHNKYDQAKAEYQHASAIKPEATYPIQRIADINKILEEILGKQQLFDNLMSGGDAFLKEKDYSQALASYTQAGGLFPEASEPREKLALVNAKIDSIYRANKGKYDKVIGDGDRYFSNYEYDKAIDAYNEAMTILPMENYPREMVLRIRKVITENAIVDVFKSTVTIAAGEEKQFSFTPVNMASRKDNFIYIKLRNLSDKTFNVLLRYGKDKSPGGGVVIRNVTPDGKVNERLISVKDQDTWYRMENNWISLYPQGGDIEVSFIQVSRSR